jgi:hypothetical protein
LSIKIVPVAEVAPVYAGPKGNVPKKASNIGVMQKKKRQPAKKSTKSKEKAQPKLKSATKKRKSFKEDEEDEDVDDDGKHDEDEEEDDEPPSKKYKVGSSKTLRKAVSAPKITKKSNTEVNPRSFNNYEVNFMMLWGVS